jgi:hypothetical protein
VARRTIELNETGEPATAGEPEVITQRKRPEVGRYWLQVDRQTKSSFATAGAAETAGMEIKKGYPVVQVSVYDSIESVSTPVDFPVQSSKAAT